MDFKKIDFKKKIIMDFKEMVLKKLDFKKMDLKVMDFKEKIIMDFRKKL